MSFYKMVNEDCGREYLTARHLVKLLILILVLIFHVPNELIKLIVRCLIFVVHVPNFMNALDSHTRWCVTWGRRMHMIHYGKSRINSRIELSRLLATIFASVHYYQHPPPQLSRVKCNFVIVFVECRPIDLQQVAKSDLETSWHRVV